MKMAEHSTEILNAVQEIRELLRLLAEPAVAERDRKYRAELRRIVGESAVKSKSVLLMDGTRTQASIRKETGMHQGNLSTLVKQLKGSSLISGDTTQPKSTISLPANFFEDGETDE
jgi:hypothetical protein